MATRHSDEFKRDAVRIGRIKSRGPTLGVPRRSLAGDADLLRHGGARRAA
jgi:hypothetical protein